MNRKYYSPLIFELSRPGREGFSLPADSFPRRTAADIPQQLRRQRPPQILPEADEQTVVRHYVNQSGNNYGVDTGFYPLGSCTMKYNPKINEEVSSCSAFSQLHPLQPAETVQGVLAALYDVGRMLAAVCGMSRFTLSPCAGAHGELTGLMVVRAYHNSRHDRKRTRIIVPNSAHGTNPASAAVCGLEVAEVGTAADGTVDLRHLSELLDDSVAGMMMTNPNTLGLFETHIPEIAQMVHQAGGLMYYDGANLNPLLGVCRPGDMGFDVMHLNLHKTFSTPHGGGGPGAGPVGVRAGLERFLPGPRIVRSRDGRYSVRRARGSAGSVSTFFGNTAIVLRAYSYLLTLGRENLAKVGPLATLNANYLRRVLADDYLPAYDRVCKHEFVLDGLRDKSSGVTTLDVAKRLLDYGFHSPTIYFPLLVHQAMMIEPTETESLDTLKSFAEAMHRIADEARHEPDKVKTAPHETPIGRADDALAVRQMRLTYQDLLAAEADAR